MLPGFGEGFIAACLQQLGGSPERVLNALLEGSLPPQLQGMDQQMGLAQWQAAADGGSSGGGGGDDKGKGPAGGPHGDYDADFPLAPGAGRPGGPSAAAATAAAAKPRPESMTARYLDVRDANYRDALVSAATAAQVSGEPPGGLVD